MKVCNVSKIIAFTDGSGKSITLPLPRCIFASKIVKRSTTKILLIALAVIAIVSTSAIFIIGSQSYSSSQGGAITGTSNHIEIYDCYLVFVPVSIASWLGFGIVLAFWRGSYGRSAWRKAGLDKNVYDLMVKMRGGNSRLELLRNLESPRQRNELSQLTGMDWKEVDRQVNLLQSYGLVSVYVESGSVKMFKLTEQGHLFLKLMGELNQ